jgi:hypothetical protein
MSRRRPKKSLADTMIEHAHWKGIKITVVEDDRSPQQIQTDLRAIWRKSKIWNVAQGFSFVPVGRDGKIYFRRGEKIIVLGVEPAGDPSLDIVVYDDGIRQWIDSTTLECEPVSLDDQRAIRSALIDWLAKRGTKFSLGGVVHQGPHRG